MLYILKGKNKKDFFGDDCSGFIRFLKVSSLFSPTFAAVVCPTKECR